MSNRYRPHLLVLPEDEADQDIANGVKLSYNIDNRAMIIDKPAKGWRKVVSKLTGQVAEEMRKYQSCHVVLLIDFDCKASAALPERRFKHIVDEIPEDLRHRVYVLGALSGPEVLKRTLNLSLEEIGGALVEDCPEQKNPLWSHELLRHNVSEVDRLVASVKGFLFVD